MKIDENWLKLANTDWELLPIFWANWGNSMKFLGMMCLKIILKVIKIQIFTLSLGDTFFEPPNNVLELKVKSTVLAGKIIPNN